MTIKNQLITITISLILSNRAYAEESAKVVSSDDLTSFKWGMSQAQFMGGDQSKYGKPLQDKGENIFTSNDYVTIADAPFKQIVRIQGKKGLTSFNYMNISNKETFKETGNILH